MSFHAPKTLEVCDTGHRFKNGWIRRRRRKYGQMGIWWLVFHGRVLEFYVGHLRTAIDRDLVLPEFDLRKATLNDRNID